MVVAYSRQLCIRFLYQFNMPKAKATLSSKVEHFVKEHPSEFVKTPRSELYCNLCNCVVSCEKKFLVDSHRQTAKHCKRLVDQSSSGSQSFLAANPIDFTAKVTSAFLSANIPLYKLNNKELQNLFKEMGHTLLLGTSCRGKLDELADLEFVKCQIWFKVERYSWFGLRATSTADSFSTYSLVCSTIRAPAILLTADIPHLTSTPPTFAKWLMILFGECGYSGLTSVC